MRENKRKRFDVSDKNLSVSFHEQERMTTTYHINGAYLKRSIKEAGYSLDEFVKELGISKTAFYYYRMGTRPVPHLLRPHIENLLRCSFHTFFLPDGVCQKETDHFHERERSHSFIMPDREKDHFVNVL